MATVVLERVSKVFAGGIVAVDNLSLEVNDQELLVLVGPSGCGKTSTLRLIAGLEAADGGSIHIGGRLVNDLPARARDVAMVMQNHSLYPHMNVYGNMAFGLKLRRRAAGRWPSWRSASQHRDGDQAPINGRRIEQQVMDAAHLAGIESLLYRKPNQLSGGESQRVALARALVRRPAVFLFDEPLSNLDAQARVAMRPEIKRIQRQTETTMVYVTHDQVEALSLGDRIAVVDRGAIQQIAVPREVYDRPKNRFVASFLGSPAMNLIEGCVESTAGQAVFRAGAVTVALDQAIAWPAEWTNGRKVSLGIRPEDVMIRLQPDDSRSASTGSRPNEIPAKVATVEHVGDATLVQIDLLENRAVDVGGRASQQVRIGGKLPAWTRVDVGERVAVQFDWQRVHWFDHSSGERLTYADRGEGRPRGHGGNTTT